MPNPTHRANDEQTAAAPADNVRLIVAHGKIKFPNPFSDKINAVFLRNGSHHDALGLTAKMRPPRELLPQERPNDEKQGAEQPQDMGVAEDRRIKSECETCFPTRLMRSAGTIIGFVLGGLVGAAFGSVVGTLAGIIVAEQNNNIWRKLKLIGLWRARGTSNDHRSSCAEVDSPWQDS